jgi:hypothetical protein
VVTADDVRRVGLALPRTYEFLTGGRAKLKVRQIVYVGFSRDESVMGFGYPRDARDGLIESAPDTFLLPPPRDLRYQWVCARLDRLDPVEMRELVTEAWRMCTPRMLHDLPEMEPPTAAAWNAVDSASGTSSAACCTPTCTSPTGRSRSGGGRRCSRTCGPTRPRSRPPRWRSATARSTAGRGDPHAGSMFWFTWKALPGS